MSKELTFRQGVAQLLKQLEADADKDNEEAVASAEDLPEGESLGPVSIHSGFSAIAKAGDDEEEDDGESIVASQLIKVKLSSEEKKAYTKFFYPRSPSTFLPIVGELAKVSSRLNGFFALMRYCLVQSRRLAMMDKETQRAAVNAEADRILKNVETTDPGERAGEFLDGLAPGNAHVIQPSTRYKGGMDIQFIGPVSSPVSSQGQATSLSVPYGEYGIIDFAFGDKAQDLSYQSEYLESYASELSLKVTAAAKEVMHELLGDDSTASAAATSRIVRTIPFDFDFAKLNEIFFNHTGILLQTDFIEGIDPAVQKVFGQFMSACVVRSPNGKLIKEMQKAMSNNERIAKRESEASGTEVAPKALSPDMANNMLTDEGMAMSQHISFSFSINLPKYLADYITQTEAGEKLSKLALHNWISTWTKTYVKKKGGRVQGGGKRVRSRDLPKFVLPLSKASRATEIRKQNDFHIEEGKGDDNNIFIAPNGSLEFGLPASAREAVSENLLGYEKDMEEHIQFCYDHGMPITTSTVLPAEVKVQTGDYTLGADFKARSNHISSYSGKLLSYDWDYNNTITAKVDNPSAIVANDLVGAATPDAVSLADYLGKDFAEEGEDPIRKSFADSMVLMVNHTLTNKDGVSADAVGDKFDPVRFIGAKGSVGFDLISFYQYNLIKGRVPAAAELITKAAAELGISALDETMDQLFKGVITKEIGVGSTAFEGPRNIGNFLQSALRRTLEHIGGGPLFRQAIVADNDGIDMRSLNEMVEEHPHFFTPAQSPAADFGRAYNYIGGVVWKLAMEALLELNPTQLFSIEEDVMIPGEFTDLKKPGYNAIARRIIPQAVLFAKYIPNAESIIAEAEKEIDANTPDDDLSEDDIKISGANEGAQMFPHQVKTHGALRKRPKFAILDIAPGGGKTSIGVTDIGAMVKEIDEEKGKKLTPLLLCPDGLIKNWCDDMKIFTGNKWNMIPINKHVIDRWGYDKLEELIRSAPVNTIVVCGFNVLTSRIENIVFGTHSVKISNNLEFMKRFGFDYILIDESHKLKNKLSIRHRSIKQLTTASHVRYLRLATGTLISNRVNDIVGQTSLYNGHIFRDSEVSSASVADSLEKRMSVNGEEVAVWEVDNPKRARQKLSRYSSLTTLKKKEWAFMLPSPIEMFYAVDFVPSGADASEEDVRNGELHQQLYDTVLQDTTEALEELIKKAGKNRAEAEDDDEEEDGDPSTGAVGNMEMEEGDELGMLSAADLKPYLARLERLVTNPMMDEAAPEIFGLAGVKELHSNKAKFIGKLIDKHFNVVTWSPDKVYEEYTLVAFEGKLYLSRKKAGGSPVPVLLPPETKGVSPSQDTDTWKEEPEGKVIVFCRYTNSVNGVYAALPEKYKKIAVKFTGEEDDKWANFDSFMNDPKIKILVANEMGIAEGHNMQMASRIIRVESPWAPGDLDQSSSRIFRPDPKAAKEMVKNGKPGELNREAIFLDWVLSNNTMEVAKQARLIKKIVDKTMFDEADNPAYDDALAEYDDLEEVRMNLDTLRSRADLRDFAGYVQAYAAINGLQREEFHAMRAGSDHTMKNITAQEEVAGSAKIQTPYVTNQKPDEDGTKGLVSVSNLLRRESYSDYRDDPEKLIGLPVDTDLGKGRIAKVRPRYLMRAILDSDGKPVKTAKGVVKKEYVLDPIGNKTVNPDNPIVNVTIKSVDTNEIMPLFKDAGILFVPTKLTQKQVDKDYHVNNLRTTKSEEKKAEREADKVSKVAQATKRKEQKAAEREEEKALIAEAKRRKKAKKLAAEKRAAAKAAKERKTNIERGKPINSGVRRTSDVPAIPKMAEEEQLSITLHPAFYHGYLTLEVKASDASVMDQKGLSKFGFKYTGEYAYVPAMTLWRFYKILDHLEDKFVLSKPSVRRLDAIQDAYEEGKKALYKMELAPTGTMPYFFSQRKKRVEKRNEIRPYGILMPQELQIAVDLATSPAIRKYIGKSIPGAAAKWTLHKGHYLFFAKSKPELRAQFKKLKTAGFTIENEKDALAEISGIKFRASSSKKK